MKINYKKLILYILSSFIIGGFFAIFVKEYNFYNNLNKIVNVPIIAFPIVWSFLYLLMGISVYLISESKDINKKNAIKSFYIQLIINSLWTLIFFGFKLYILACTWIILLIILVLIMIIKFYKINKIAGIINIPYLLWLIFALVLNYSIIVLN